MPPSPPTFLFLRTALTPGAGADAAMQAADGVSKPIAAGSRTEEEEKEQVPEVSPDVVSGAQVLSCGVCDEYVQDGTCGAS